MFGAVDTSKPHCRLTDVIIPEQSFLNGVPDSVPVVTSERNLSSYLSLSETFGRTAFEENYDPWQCVDNFGRARIYRSLLAAAKAKESGPKVASINGDSDGASSVVDPEMAKSACRLNRKRVFGDVPASEVADGVDKVKQCYSKK